MKLWGVAAAAAIGIATTGISTTASAQAVTPDAAKQTITTLGDRAVKTLSMQGNAQERNNQFTQLLVDGLDFDALATSTLGKLARTVSPQDKKEFTRLFAAYVIDVAIEKFGSVHIKGFNIGAVAPQPNGDAKVRTKIQTADKPLEVDWRVRNAGGALKINDMEVEGYSLAIHYRGEFERAGLSTVPGLIARLKELTKNSKAMPAVQQAMK